MSSRELGELGAVEGVARPGGVMDEGHLSVVAFVAKCPQHRDDRRDAAAAADQQEPLGTDLR
jgi:hypothetical protein